MALREQMNNRELNEERAARYAEQMAESKEQNEQVVLRFTDLPEHMAVAEPLIAAYNDFLVKGNISKWDLNVMSWDNYCTIRVDAENDYIKAKNAYNTYMTGSGCEYIFIASGHPDSYICDMRVGFWHDKVTNSLYTNKDETLHTYVGELTDDMTAVQAYMLISKDKSEEAALKIVREIYIEVMA